MQLNSIFKPLDIWRMYDLWPPLKALRDTTALPSGVFAPVDLAQGFHCLMALDCLALRSGVQVIRLTAEQ